jgi:hypothetical protein
MIVYGYAKDYSYTSDGTLMIQVRIPSVDGPVSQSEYNGQKVTNYKSDSDLSWYPSLLLPHLPNTNEVVALTSINSSCNDWLVIGLMGSEYGV